MLKLDNSKRAPRTLTGRAGESSVPPVAIVLLVLIALLVGSTVYLYLELRATKLEMAERFQGLDEQVAQIEGNVNRTSRDVGTRVEEVKSLVASAEKQIDAKTRGVEQRVLSKASAIEQDLRQTKQQQQAALTDVGSKVSQLSEVATNTESRVGNLSGRVDTVKKDLDETTAELEKTIADLKSVRGDLGVQSGLIATNGDELLALKRMGERNFYEFQIAKSKNAQRVGKIQIRLRDANDKRGRYTIDVLADDKTIQKKNKTLLEPVQFYVIGARQPYEIVVNKVEKNKISGYLATPLCRGERD